MLLTPEQIAEKADKLDGKRNKAEINRLFRLQDESHKWPIRGEFDVTERAIRKVRKDGGSELYGLEYAYALDVTISEIVNSSI